MNAKLFIGGAGVGLLPASLMLDHLAGPAFMTVLGPIAASSFFVLAIPLLIAGAIDYAKTKKSSGTSHH